MKWKADVVHWNFLEKLGANVKRLSTLLVSYDATSLTIHTNNLDRLIAKSSVRYKHMTVESFYIYSHAQCVWL